MSFLGKSIPAGAACKPFATGFTPKSRSTINTPAPQRPLSTYLLSASASAATFQHLAITFCRALNIPARYATGYLGDIGVPVRLPMDFSAWFEAYLGGRWWTFDARNNQPRMGRILMATGKDAADVAMTTSFGQADLRSFFVVTEEETAALAEKYSHKD